jgi:hypothetical protein
MFKQSVTSIILKNLSNIPGWRIKRKLVVIESDDWGSIRMPSSVVFDSLMKEGIDLTSDEGFRYNKYDSIETSDDIASLFEVLNAVKDSTGRSAVMTPVSVVANPDFNKIRQSRFTEYFFEPFTETLKKYPGCENSVSLWHEGIVNRLFVPQFHGREHLNVKVWMRALEQSHINTRKAFDHGMWGISTMNDPLIRVELQAAFDFIDPRDLMYHKEVIISGLDLFEKLFGYRAAYFVPPNGPLSSKMEEVCSAEGIKMLSVPKLQVEPLGNGLNGKRFHWLGQRNSRGLTYLIRNCFFEPSEQGKNWVDKCLSDIAFAFRWNKPAIISTHRVNFTGGLYKNNRDKGLNQLHLLLKNIVKMWPETEFITSAELGEIMNNE